MKKIFKILFIIILSIGLFIKPVYATLNTFSTDLEKDSSQYWSITNGDQTGLSLTSDLTLEGCAKLETNQGENTVISKYNPGGDNRAYYLNIIDDVNVEAIAFWYSSDGTNVNKDELRSDDLNFTTGVWYCVAMSWDASGSTARFFLDGEFVSTTSGSETSIYVNTSPFLIGVKATAGEAFFDGLIDEVRVWNDIRTDQEISDNWDSELVGNEAGLVSYWKFNNDGTDENANANDLTNNNSATFSSDVPFPGSAPAAQIRRKKSSTLQSIW